MQVNLGITEFIQFIDTDIESDNDEEERFLNSFTSTPAPAPLQRTTPIDNTVVPDNDDTDDETVLLDENVENYSQSNTVDDCASTNYSYIKILFYEYYGFQTSKDIDMYLTELSKDLTKKTRVQYILEYQTSKSLQKLSRDICNYNYGFKKFVYVSALMLHYYPFYNINNNIRTIMNNLNSFKRDICKEREEELMTIYNNIPIANALGVDINYPMIKIAGILNNDGWNNYKIKFSKLIHNDVIKIYTNHFKETRNTMNALMHKIRFLENKTLHDIKWNNINILYDNNILSNSCTDLNCCICLENNNNIIYNCGHSTCDECIVTLYTNGNKMQCPLCRSCITSVTTKSQDVYIKFLNFKINLYESKLV